MAPANSCSVVSDGDGARATSRARVKGETFIGSWLATVKKSVTTRTSMCARMKSRQLTVCLRLGAGGTPWIGPRMLDFRLEAYGAAGKVLPAEKTAPKVT